MYVKKYYSYINNTFRTIIDKCDYLCLSNGADETLFLTWDKDNKFEDAQLPNITKISERNEIAEDDVTYITIHNVFKENNINLVCVSFPGAQSDMPFLPETNLGRSQKRVYVDAVGEKNNTLILQENKGAFKKTEIKDDIEKINLFKHDSNYIEAVVKFNSVHGLKTKKIIIGIGFGESNKMNSQLNQVGIDQVDYFLVISEGLKKWKIFSNIDEDIFNVKNGVVQMTQTFEVSK